jgi:hypothetical protein
MPQPGPRRVNVRLSVLVSGLLIAAASLTVRAARAGDQEYPVSFVERPLTLPKFTLAPSLELDVTHVGVAGPGGGSLTSAGMQIGATFGITDNIEVGTILVPVQFNNGAGFGAVPVVGFVGEEGTPGYLSFYGTFRFLHTEMLDLGARLRVEIVTNSVTGAVIEPSVPLLLHIGKIGRLDAELGIPITVLSTSASFGVVGGTQVAAGLDVPIKLAFDIIEPLHVGVSTGVKVDDFSQAGASTAIPLGVFMGYAIGEKRPLIDIDPFFNFYQFITPGDGLFDHKVNPGVFVVGVSARGYVYF